MLLSLFGFIEPPKNPLIYEPEPIVITEPAIEPVIELTIEEKIASNYYVCDESIHFIRADTAECLNKPVNVQVSRQNTPQTIRNVSKGNGYAPGNCTAFIKDVVSWIPNGLGNANTWDDRARSMGFVVNTAPAAGSVGVSNSGRYGHVFRVNSVNSDGSINISDMNYRNLYEVTHRTISASGYYFIHPY